MRHRLHKDLDRIFQLTSNLASNNNDSIMRVSHTVFAILTNSNNVSGIVIDKLQEKVDSLIGDLKDFYKSETDNLLSDKKTSEEAGHPVFSEELKTIINDLFRSKPTTELITIEDFFITLFNTLYKHEVFVILEGFGITRSFMTDAINNIGQASNVNMHDEDEPDVYRPNKNKNSKTPFLDEFGRDLTEMAKKGELDPVYNRVEETERMAQILARRKKNNPVLVGSAGCGKTAISENLAQLIINKKCPRPLLNKRVVALDLAALVAGTKYRGQFEERIKTIIEETKVNKNVILFIDEIHMLVGAGNAAGSMDAANIFKPALARGEVQCIGATTIDEYRESIEQDGALERRFQKIIIDEPSIEDTIEMLKILKPRYEDYHKVEYTDESIHEMVRLSDRYITNRSFPDKAIDVMDEAGARCQVAVDIPAIITKLEDGLSDVRREMNRVILNNDYDNAQALREKEKDLMIKLDKENKKWNKSLDSNRKIITPEMVAKVVSIITKIPIDKLSKTERHSLKNIHTVIKKHIVGQDDAVDKVALSIKRNRLGLTKTNKPIGVFLFVGNTGTGKTYLAKMLAKYVFGSENNLIRFDMSEYSQPFNISRLIGCFVPDSLVQMGDGSIKKIDDIKRGDVVLTHKGQLQPVLETFKYEQKGNMIEIIPANSNIPIICTPNHEILSIKLNKYNNRFIAPVEEDIKWVSAEDLSEDDVVLYPKYIKGKINNLTIDLLDLIKNLPKYKYDDDFVWCYKNHKFNRFITIDEKLMRLAGYYSAEGGVDKPLKSVSFTFNSKETEYINEVIVLFKSIFGQSIEPYIYHKKRNGTSVTFTSKAAALFFSHYFGRFRKEKKVAEFIKDLPSELIYPYLETLLFGDGTLGIKRKVIYTSASPNLFFGVEMLFRNLGYLTQKIRRKNKKCKNCNELFRLIITGDQIVNLSNQLPNLKINLDGYQHTNIQRKSYVMDNYLGFRIKKVNITNYSGYVHDIHVNNDMSYVVNGICVHNSSPGYVGYEKGGQLTERVRNNPYSVVLFDEIEKAHPDVYNIFLQLFDEGRLTDEMGKTVNFKNTIIIMTSNVGSKDIQMFGKGIGYRKNETTNENTRFLLEKAMKKEFKPEFLNRIDEIVQFNNLDENNIKNIIDLQLKELIERAKENNYVIKIGDGVKDKIFDDGYDDEYGAREIQRTIQRLIENPISDKLLDQDVIDGIIINVLIKDDKVDFDFSTSYSLQEAIMEDFVES